MYRPLYRSNPSRRNIVPIDGVCGKSQIFPSKIGVKLCLLCPNYVVVEYSRKSIQFVYIPKRLNERYISLGDVLKD